MTIFEKVKKKADLCFISLVTWLLFFFFWNLICWVGKLGLVVRAKIVSIMQILIDFFLRQSQIHCWLEILVTQKSYANSSLVLFGGIRVKKVGGAGKNGGENCLSHVWLGPMLGHYIMYWGNKSFIPCRCFLFKKPKKDEKYSQFWNDCTKTLQYKVIVSWPEKLLSCYFIQNLPSAHPFPS